MIHFKNTKNIDLPKKTIISTNENLDYAFFLPIVFKAWLRIGYHPVCVVVGDVNNWSLPNSKYHSVFNHSLNAGGDLVFLDASKNKLLFFEQSAVAQVSRLCSYCLPFDLETYYLTSDADMIPVNKDWFEQQDYSKDVHLFYANAYPNRERHVLCYNGAKGLVWQKITNNIFDDRPFYTGPKKQQTPIPLSSRDFYYSIANIFSNLRPGCPKKDQWNHDELYFSRAVKRYEGYNNSCQMIDMEIYNNPRFRRGSIGVPAKLPKGRLDRSNWNFTGNINEVIDAHCKRPAYTDDNWTELRYLLSTFFNDDEMKFVDNFVKEFREKICL